MENLVQVTEFVEGILTTEKISAKIIAQVNVAVDEIFSNIARYSEATMATVECEVRDDKVILQFSDDGIPYDLSLIHISALGWDTTACRNRPLGTL